MILQKALLYVACAAALAAAAAAGVVALAYALYAYAAQFLSPAASAAVVAGAVALIFLILALVLMARALIRANVRARQPSLGVRAMEFARERPLVAAAGALVASFFALKNPSALMAVVLAFMEGRSDKKR